MKLVLFVLLLSVVVTITIAQNSETDGEKKIVCYYTNWAPNRPQNASFTPSTINPNICTHLIYAFATFSNTLGIAPGDENQDITKNGFREFTDLKKLNENLKTQLSIGGWAESSARFSKVSASETRRRYFTQSAIELLRKYDFDGLNLDWQYPTFRDGSREEDYENYVKLVQAIREGFEEEAKMTNKSRLIITMSVPAETEYNEQGYDLLNLQKYADFFNILAYDYHLSYEPNVGHHTPLYPLPQEIKADVNVNLNADATVQFLLKKGVKKENLNLGIPTYGRTYRLENENDHDLGASSKGLGIRGETSKEEGYRTYYEICQSILAENWTVIHLNDSAIGPFAFKGENWVGYDDEGSVRAKGEYVRKQGLGGIMFWTIDDDDFKANCGNRSFPLIKAGREGLLGLGRMKAISRPRGAPVNTTVSRTLTTKPITQSTTETVSLMKETTSNIDSSTNGITNTLITDNAVNKVSNNPDKNSVLPQPTQGPIRISGTKREGGDTYHQSITIWIINNILNFGDKL